MVQSMTAFSRMSDRNNYGMIICELKSVNHRYFDCIIKAPDALRQFESDIRLLLQQRLHRGRIECVLKFQPNDTNSSSNLALNVGLVKNLAHMIEDIRKYLPQTSTIDPVSILLWPDILQSPEVDYDKIKVIFFQFFEYTLEGFIRIREQEGSALAELIAQKLKNVFTIVDDIKQRSQVALFSQRAKLKIHLEEIKAEIDNNRLEQELVYFAQKIDVSEELDRVQIHAEEIKRLLEDKNIEPIGKRLDFLMQELNREANTLAAKSVDIKIIQGALELKVLVEQMREQIQNIV